MGMLRHQNLSPLLQESTHATAPSDSRASTSNPCGNEMKKKTMAAELLYSVIGPVDGLGPWAVTRIAMYQFSRNTSSAAGPALTRTLSASL